MAAAHPDTPQDDRPSSMFSAASIRNSIKSVGTSKMLFSTKFHKQPSVDLCFEVVTRGRVFVVAADTVKTKNIWMRRLKESIMVERSSLDRHEVGEAGQLCGWLTKQGGNWKTWHRRWFVLEVAANPGEISAARLAYYADPSAHDVKGAILLCDVVSVRDANALSVHRPSISSASGQDAPAGVSIADLYRGSTREGLLSKNPLEQSSRSARASRAARASSSPGNARGVSFEPSVKDGTGATLGRAKSEMAPVTAAASLAEEEVEGRPPATSAPERLPVPARDPPAAVTHDPAAASPSSPPARSPPAASIAVTPPRSQPPPPPTPADTPAPPPPPPAVASAPATPPAIPVLAPVPASAPVPAAAQAAPKTSPPPIESPAAPSPAGAGRGDTAAEGGGGGDGRPTAVTELKKSDEAVEQPQSPESLVSTAVPDVRLSASTEQSPSVLLGTTTEEHQPVSQRGSVLMSNRRMLKSVTAIGAQVQFQYLEKDRLLGAGSFGSVYEGKYFEQNVAIKYLTSQDLSDEALEEFSHEADLHFHLRHQNIVELMCYNTDPELGEICMVMQKLDCSLHDILHESDEDLHFTARLDMIENMARGLMYLHSLGIVHLDLKSMNMLLDKKKVIKICDFGLSRVKEEVKKDGDEEGEATAAGSLPWMAPELMLGEKPTVKADVFSFYVIMWEVMARKKPHENKKVTQVIRAVSKQKKRLEMPDNMPEQLEELFRRCWAPVPDDRPSMEEVVQSVLEIRKNPRLRVTTAATLEGEAAFNYKLKNKTTKLPVLSSPEPTAELLQDQVVTGPHTFNVQDHLVVANLIGRHDQLFLKLCPSTLHPDGGWVQAFEPTTGELLVEQSMSVIGPQALLNDALKIGLRELCTAFRTHIANEEVVFVACRMIYSETRTPSALEALNGCGAIESIVRTMKCYPGNSQVVYVALAAIMNLVRGNSTLMLEAGIVPCLLSALCNHTKDADVQHVCLGAIQNLSFASAPGSNTNEALHELCPHIVNTLVQHQDQDRVQQFGWACVAHLSSHNAANQASFTEAGACAAVMTTLRLSEESCPVCEACCFAITYLARNNEANQNTFAEAEACELVVRTVNQFSPNPSIVTRGIGAIIALSASNESIVERLGAAGACRLVVHALGGASENPTVAQQCLGALQQMTIASESNKNRMIEAGGPAVMLEAIASHAAKLDLLYTCLAVTLNLTFAKAFAERLAEQPWTGFLQHMEQNPLDNRLQEMGCGLISNVSHHVPTVCKVLGDDGACERVMEALANHTKHPRTVELSFRAISNLCNPRPQDNGRQDEASTHASQQNLTRLRELGARGAIQAAMDAHKSVSVLQQWGGQCLKML